MENPWETLTMILFIVLGVGGGTYYLLASINWYPIVYPLATFGGVR